MPALSISPAQRLVLLLLPLFFLVPETALANSRVYGMGPTGRVHGTSTGLSGLRDAMGDSVSSRSDNCSFCHQRVGTQDKASYGESGILWNVRAGTSSDWRMYGSDPTMLAWIDGTVEPAPTGSSKLCLGCHDGVTAVNQADGRSVGSSAGSAIDAFGYRSSVALGSSGTGLTNNHPISISYAWTRDSQLHNPASAFMGDGRSVQALLEDGRVECATCHDVHTAPTATNTAMLRTTTMSTGSRGRGASSLCLVCHDK